MGTLSVDKLVKTSAGASEFTLPAADGTANQVMQTDGSGQLSFATISSDPTMGGDLSGAASNAQIVPNAVTTTEIIDNAVTGAKIAMGSDAAGDVLYYNGTDYVRLGAGTASQTLKMNSGAVAPEWVTVSAGSAGMTLLLNADVSSPVASYTISSTYINSTYDEYFMYFDVLPASDNAILYVKAVVGGSVVTASDLSYESQRIGGSYASGGVNNNSSNIFAYITTAGMGNGTGQGCAGYFHLQNVNSTTRPAGIHGMSYWSYYDGEMANGTVFSGQFQSSKYAQVLNGLNFITNGGNITTANFKLYGMKK